MAKLVEGKIPPKTVCPYRGGCLYAESTIESETPCKHKGIDHEEAYSCATARSLELIVEVGQQWWDDF